MDALDERSCFEAIRRRDKRFDGRFYTGVTSTGIYCRPSCPARTPKRSNVLFFHHPASAAQKGFRPCRRCRPEFSPGSTEWNRRADTVSRAVAAVNSGRFKTVAELASHLGVGQRHLRRELQAGLGATAQSLLTTQRSMLARLLLDQTSLPITEVAFAAGFGSVRRFNETMQETFAATPTALRSTSQRTGGRVPPHENSTITLHLASQGVVNWPFLRTFLQRRAIPGLEEVVGPHYRLCVPAGSVDLAGSEDDTSLQVTCRLASLEDLQPLLPRIKRLVDLDTNTSEIADTFKDDPVLGPRTTFGVPPLPVTSSIFEACIRAIVGQQISVAGARTFLQRLLVACHSSTDEVADSSVKPPFGTFDHFPTPDEVLAADLSSIGLVASRLETIKNLATDVVSGAIELAGQVSADQLHAQLLAVRGIGPWTAGYALMRGLGDPDGWPTNDLVLRASTGLDARLLEEASSRWRPWRAYAALLLWTSYTESTEP